MMPLRIAYNLNGVMAITTAAPKETLEPLLGAKDLLRFKTLSDEDYRAFIFASIPNEATNIHELPDNWEPPEQSREFRNAWVTDGKEVSVDMNKAREIHRDNLRKARLPLLAQLDIEMTKAYKDQNTQDLIESKRQVLRDVTTDPGIESATTVEELRACVPEVLKGIK